MSPYRHPLKKSQAKSWAAKLRRLVEEDGVRTPEAILVGLGMQNPDQRAQILREYERESA